ncbi:thiol-disulfide oxidoreductase DCC family protein [Rummeliibacillus pycnus]|uniref:thiol-disulfide oxidoreductase DCC family protein n=1 Tax=Rummeliibacillus pycnus TaxID=101070 RepID=UPI000C9B04FF|nr:DCC1-like thiol-disulfide oxidoreductase family protein [Rummeliibacillus pycnus]
MNSILFYDGDCGFCQRSVQFVLKHEREPVFNFAPLQGKVATKLLPVNLTQNLDTIVVYQEGKMLTESSAILFIAKNLNFPYLFLIIFKVIPTPIRDYFYRIISRNRYKFTYSRNICKIPKENVRKRFLE